MDDDVDIELLTFRSSETSQKLLLHPSRGMTPFRLKVLVVWGVPWRLSVKGQERIPLCLTRGYVAVAF